jgi:hypothetical protein
MGSHKLSSELLSRVRSPLHRYSLAVIPAMGLAPAAVVIYFIP